MDFHYIVLYFLTTQMNFHTVMQASPATINPTEDLQQSLKLRSTQPLLTETKNGSTDCIFKETQFNDDGGGAAIYLDRHSLQCPTGYVMNYMKLERNSDLNKIRYRYKCCKSQLSCSEKLTTNKQTNNGGGLGNTVLFDRQTIQCNKKGINYLKLDRSGDVWNYKYDCCDVAYASSLVSCYDLKTAFSDDGDGSSFNLIRHTIKCNSDEDFFTYIQLVQNPRFDKIRFNYKCCSINVITQRTPLFTTPDTSSDTSKQQIYVVVGGIAGSVFVVIIFMCIIAFLVYRRKHQCCLKVKVKKQKSTMTKELSETNISVVVEDGNHVYTDLDKLARGKSLAYEELKKKTGSINLQPYEIMSLSIMASSRHTFIYEVPPDDGN